MTKEEQKEFAEMPVDYLVNKWTYAIACRNLDVQGASMDLKIKKTIKRL
ncbi:MAG: hypothetical protein ACLTS6_09210 [Anaerobutyricum sp.]